MTSVSIQIAGSADSAVGALLCTAVALQYSPTKDLVMIQSLI